ncbi:MAG: hypothetical protein Q4E24_15940 [bacterium]|nr:hypothetical protein [bacterium]
MAGRIGAYFKKREKLYRIDRNQQMMQAEKAEINYKRTERQMPEWLVLQKNRIYYLKTAYL